MERVNPAQGKDSCPSHCTPLPTVGHWIRLLTLLPGDASDDITISLAPALLSADEPPVYEALSYVRGSTDDPGQIHLAAQHPIGLLVTRNLFHALQNLRSAYVPRILWIDAICINQNDLEEKGTQVARMNDVYRLADRVVIWLGPDEGADEMVLGIFEDIGSKIEVNWKEHSMKPSQKGLMEPYLADPGVPVPFGELERAMVDAFLSRPWFERVWIIQEVRLASPKTICMCGQIIIEWNTLRNALYCIISKGFHLHRTGSNNMQRHTAILDTFDRSQNYSLSDILAVTRGFKCTNERDRVYAMLGVVTDSLGIFPDYTLSIRKVYMNTVRRCIENSHSLDILTACTMGSVSASDWPTWVPDWSQARDSNFIGFGYAGGFAMPDATFIGDEVLQVAAVKCGTIADCLKFQVESVLALRGGLDGLFSEIRRLGLPPGIFDKPYMGGTTLEAFCTHMFSVSQI